MKIETLPFTVDGDWIPISEGLPKEERSDKCKNCEYYLNPDYTRCHECKAESEGKNDT